MIPRSIHDAEQTMFIMDGKGDVMIGSETVSVKRGDVFFVPLKAVHSCRAEKDIKLLCFATII